MLNIYCSAIVFLLFTNYLVEATYGDECLTPTNIGGQCVPIRSCKHILSIIQRHGAAIAESDLQFIRQSSCGIFNNAHHVCCAKDEITLNSVGLGLLEQVACGYFSIPRVAHGQEAELFSFPWMALLKYNNGKPFRCGASLISERYVLTAAHCVVGHEQNLIEVRLGEHKISTEIDCQKFGKDLVCADPVEDVGIEQIIAHAGYRPNRIHHDIALLRLNRTVQFQKHIRAICLPIYQQLMNRKPEEYIVSGWGYTEKGETSDTLMWTTVPRREGSDCAKAFRLNDITDGHICAGGENLQDSCRGDSGGPLSQSGVYNKRLRLIQYGIVSLGIKSCGEQSYPAIYANVSHYMQWITDHLRV